MTYQVNTGTTYNLSLHAVAELGASRRHAMIDKVMRFDKVLCGAAAVRHVGLLAVLPAGTERDPAKLTYAQISLPSGTTEVIALAWLNAPPEEVSANGLGITIATASAQDISTIRALLVRAGFASETISFTVL